VPQVWPLLPVAAAQVPLAPVHAWQDGHEALPQQCPLTQFPPEHSLPTLHVAPNDLSGAHVLLLQPLPQVCGVPGVQPPLPSHDPAGVITPPEQVGLAPQVLPAGLLEVLVQVGRPDEHETVPFSQALPVLHDTPGVQAPHVPLLQYWFVPQDWPLRVGAASHVPLAPVHV
jgi:hypothetical protein